MSTTRSLTGKVAIVSGGGRNIGRAEALLFAQQGAKVVVNDLGGGGTGGGADESVAQAVVEEIRSAGGEAVAETSSVASIAGGQALIDAAMSAFGRIDILSNNAGVVRPRRIEAMTEKDWETLHDVTLKGYFATIRAAAPILIRQRCGVIINKGSASGFGHYGMANYAAAKEGVIGLTGSVARELGEHGVRCNSIRPLASLSLMGTPELFGLLKHVQEDLGVPALWNRMMAGSPVPLRAENVAALTVWLCMEGAKDVNGRDFFIAGGEIGIFPEPELLRAAFNPQRWDLDSLCDPSKTQYLIGDARKRFCGGRRIHRGSA